MDRNHIDQIELFRAFTVAEIREREETAALSTTGLNPFRGEDSSYGIKS